jgi:hypothetical protein
MPVRAPDTSIASYEDYLATYFPQRTSSPLSQDRSPQQMGVQLAVESLEKNGEILRESTVVERTAEQSP